MADQWSFHFTQIQSEPFPELTFVSKNLNFGGFYYTHIEVCHKCRILGIINQEQKTM